MVMCAVLAAFAIPASAGDQPSPWYFFHGSTNSHPQLDKADKQIDQELNSVFRIIAPGFDDVKTFSDQADDFMIWSPFIGVGRKFGNHWDVFFQVGGGVGKVRTESDDISILLLPWHTDVEIKRSNIFLGPGLAWYPFGFSETGRKMKVAEKIRAARPYLMTTLSWNRLTFKAHVRAGLRPFGNFVQNKQEDSWHPFSSGVGAGFDMPITKNTTLSLNSTYSFFFDYGDDFDGYNVSIFFKHPFGCRKR